MRHIKEVLRLKFQNGLSVRQIARSLGLPASTVGLYVRQVQKAGLIWPLDPDLDEQQLRQRLFPPSTAGEAGPERFLPDWAKIRQELRRKGVTLRLLWEEYRQDHPQGYGYSRFCELYQRWSKRLDPPLRQTHAPGEKMFVDWAGTTIPVHDPESGEVRQAHLFIAVLGASNLLFVEAFENEQLGSWITAHCHAYAFFGGAAKLTIPDNPKVAVLKPCRYEPGLNSSYLEMAAHFGTVVMPARSGKPRDKAKAESGVLWSKQRVVAALRDHKFFSLAALNEQIAGLRDQINQQPFQKLEGSRQSAFDAEEKACLLPLPQQPYEMARWSRAKVNIDYHVAVDKHYYSVPYTLIHQVLDVRLSERSVELFDHGKRVAAHPRSYCPGKFTTLHQHRPKSHQRHLEWTPGRLIGWARKVGPCTARVVQQILEDRPHPEQGFRSCLGIMRLTRAIDAPRVELACRRALHYQTVSYSSVKSILENNLEAEDLQGDPPRPNFQHPNLRGPEYYQ